MLTWAFSLGKLKRCNVYYGFTRLLEWLHFISSLLWPLFHHFGSDFKRGTHYSIIASVLEENDTHHLKPLSAKVCVSLKLWLMCCHFANFSPCKMTCSFTSMIVFHCLLLFVFTNLNSIYPRFLPIIPGDAVVWEKKDLKTELICLL